MFRRLFGHMRQNVVAYLALFVALGGTSAYAANEWTGANIVDESLTGQDVFNNTLAGADITNGSLTGADVFDNSLGSADITNGSLTGGDIANGSLTGSDIANESIGFDDIGSQQVGSDEVLNDSLLQSDIRAGAVTGDEVLDNSLTGADINEASLNVPATESRFTGSPAGGVALGPPLDDITSTSLSTPGNYVAIATVNTVPTSGTGDQTTTVFCGLYRDGNFIGGTESKGLNRKSLSMNGGLVASGGSTSVQVLCNSPQGGVEIARAQMMVMRISGFF